MTDPLAQWLKSLEARTRNYPRIDMRSDEVQALLECARALDSIAEHAWAAEMPKWGSEFVDVARTALARLRRLAKGDA